VPVLETLEDRCCPTAPVSGFGIVASGHTLTITGDNAAHLITINDNGQGSVFAQMTGPEGTVSRFARGIDTIRVITGDGNDSVNYALRGNLVQNLNLDIDLGNGNDRVDVSMLPAISSPRVAIDVQGGTGSDEVTTRFGQITDTVMTFRALLGQGSDIFNGYLHGDLLGSAVANFLVEGGQGSNSLSLHADGVRVDPAALLEVDLRGGSGNDMVAMTYDGELNGRLSLGEYGGAGNDRMVANLKVEPFSKGQLEGRIRGEAGDDVITFDVRDHSFWWEENPAGTGDALVKSGLSSVHLLTDGGLGADTCYHSGDVEVINCEHVDPAVNIFAQPGQ
jgi:hypothetical protein